MWGFLSRVSFYVQASHRFCRATGNGATGNIISSLLSFPRMDIFVDVGGDSDNSKLERDHFPRELAMFRGETRRALRRAFPNFCLVIIISVDSEETRNRFGSLGNYRVKWRVDRNT